MAKVTPSAHAMTQDTHKLVHNLRLSDCKTPWEKLLLSEHEYRTCPQCKSHVFQIADLNEQQVHEIALSSPIYSSTKPNVVRRPDGTLAVQQQQCREPETKSSQCKTRWENLLTGDQAYRTCPLCESHIFDTKGIDDEGIQRLARTSPLFNESKKNVLLRSDNKLIVGRRACRLSLSAYFVVGVLLQIVFIPIAVGSIPITLFTAALFFFFGLFPGNRHLLRYAVFGMILPVSAVIAFIVTAGFWLISASRH